MNNKMKAKKTNTFEWKCDGFIRSMIVNDFYKIRSVGRKFNPRWSTCSFKKTKAQIIFVCI